MRLAELQVALRAADARAVLVPPHILDQIIQEACDLHGSVWTTPHRKCFVCDRQTLFKHVDQAYLALAPDQLLPDRVILLSDPPADELSDLESKQVLLKYWRRLFHACIHLAFEEPAEATNGVPIRKDLARRVEEIGRAEFDEIRTVLSQDHYLLDEADDQTAYIEFAAVYLETRYFSASQLPGLFPGLRDLPRIDRMLAEDVDADAVFAHTRLAEAPEPVATVDTGSEEPESQERYWALVRSAERASLVHNTVGAAILRTRAWRIAPANLGQGTRDEALADMKRLSARLGKALGLNPAEADDWGKDLPLLLDKADQGDRPAEARLLYDLQTVCADDERDIYALDVIEWLLSAGKRPIKRPLPSLRLVRLARNLRGATRYLGVVRLTDADRQHFTHLVQGALERTEQAVRDRFGPVLTTALEDVGLQPTNPPERVALSKMVAEWLDRIIGYGFLTFSDLRDTISRNQLKLPDLNDPRDFMRGDPLLRLDRRLASLLDGVYKPSDIYMRWLEQLTALNFGTGIGRAFTLWVTIPLGGAALMMQAFAILFHLLGHPGPQHPVINRLYLVLVGPTRYADASHFSFTLLWHFLLLTGLSIFLMALIHVAEVRQAARRGLRATGRGLRTVFVDIPVELVQRASLQKLLTTWYFQLFWWYVIRPLILVLPAWLVLPQAVRTAGVFVVLYSATSLLLNSRIGEAASAAVVQALKSFWGLVRSGFLPGMFRLIMRAFKQIVDTAEMVLFAIDDWLRYRKGDSQASLVARTILGVLWFPFAYLARFYMLVLIEPGFNPAKAPVSYIAAKVMLPLAVPLTGFFAGALKPFVADWLAYAIVIPTVWLLPDAFGFLFWETKENWRLYRANRQKAMQPVPVGPHGETIKGLLQPGFHSGTVPRLYRRLRRAERNAYRTRNWAAARACRQELEEVSHAIDRFVSRELVALLEQTAAWQGRRLTIGAVNLAVNRVGVELSHADHTATPLRVEFELREGCLIAGLRSPGWLDQLTPPQLHAFTMVLASVYKLAGVELVREQVQANLPTTTSTWDVTPEGLVVRFLPQGPARLYPLRDTGRAVPPPAGDSAVTIAGPAEARKLVFARTPLFWRQWVANLEQPASDQGVYLAGQWDQELVALKPASVPAREEYRPVPESTAARVELA